MGMSALDLAQMAPLAGAVTGSALGSALGGGGSSGKPVDPYSTPSFVNTMNGMLTNSLNTAIQDYALKNRQAVDQQKTSLTNANNALTSGVATANQQAQNTSASGLQQYKALNAPLAAAGYAGLDAYTDSLGLKRAQMGSGAISDALFNTAQAQQNVNNLGKAPTAPTNAPIAPTAVGNLNSFKSQVSPELLQQYLHNHVQDPENGQVNSYGLYNGYGATGVNDPRAYDPTGMNAMWYGGAGGGSATNFNVSDQIKNLATTGEAQYLQQQAQQAYNQQYNKYNTKLGAYNQNANLFNTYQQQAGQAVSGVTPQQLAIANAYKNNLFQ